MTSSICEREVVEAIEEHATTRPDEERLDWLRDAQDFIESDIKGNGTAAG